MTGAPRPIFVAIRYSLRSIPKGSNHLNYIARIDWDSFSAISAKVADINIYRPKTIHLEIRLPPHDQRLNIGPVSGN